MSSKKKKKFDYRSPEALDPSKRAEVQIGSMLERHEEADDITILDSKLRTEAEARRKEMQEAVDKDMEAHVSSPTTTVSQELRRAPIITEVSDRNDARLLILTQNPRVYEENSVSQRRILEYASMFAEVHVIVLGLRQGKGLPTSRLTQNTWLYATNSHLWFMTPWNARSLAKKQLVFAAGFRPDIIVTEDPFEAGVAGVLLAKRYKRPLQVHAFEDYLDPKFIDVDPHNRWRVFMAAYTMGHADSVRTQAEGLREKIVEKYDDLESVTEVLPTYLDLNAWKDAPITATLRDRYPQFTFFIIHLTSMTERSHTDRVLNGITRMLLRYPTMGCVLVGDGPKRHWLEKHIEKLGIAGNVVFEKDVGDELISFLKTANALVYSSEDPEDERIILKAAAAGLPIVSSGVGIATQIFKDGESALICPDGNAPCFGNQVSKLLNNNQLRIALSNAAREVVFDRIEQDYTAYLTAYRASIERGIA